jgi:glyoxylase-like metal-dependent hydrolase (beta-lactamase superfamily II)
MSVDPEVIAIRYGTIAGSRARFFHGYELYDEPDGPLAMDYFFWVIRTERETVLVDCGFDPEVGRRRGRRVLIEPLEALGRIGIAADDVSRVIVTHGHYEHIGNLSQFPSATIVVQKRELDFWSSADARRRQIGSVVEADEIAQLTATLREGRVDVVDGDRELSPGIRAVVVGGHSPGQQVTIVESTERPIALASDALHFYEELERDMPFAIFTDLVAMYRAYDTLRGLRSAGAVVVAGHDPAIMTEFPAYSSETGDFAVRLA